jgi:hypothetical protein
VLYLHMYSESGGWIAQWYVYTPLWKEFDLPSGFAIPLRTSRCHTWWSSERGALESQMSNIPGPNEFRALEKRLEKLRDSEDDDAMEWATCNYEEDCWDEGGVIAHVTRINGVPVSDKWLGGTMRWRPRRMMFDLELVGDVVEAARLNGDMDLGMRDPIRSAIKWLSCDVPLSVHMHDGDDVNSFANRCVRKLRTLGKNASHTDVADVIADMTGFLMMLSKDRPDSPDVVANASLALAPAINELLNMHYDDV